MTLPAWIAIYLAQLLLWLWIVRWGGARQLEGTFTAGLLFHPLAPRWSREGLQVYALGSLVVSTFWFLLGLFLPQVRPLL
jgi:hypothetical protein